MKSKSAMRAEVRRTMLEMDDDYIRESDTGIFKALIGLQELNNAETVFAYYSVGREVDTHEIISHCLSAGKKVALPVVFGDGAMVFAKYLGEAQSLTGGSLNIPQPESDSERLVPKSGDIILVPALSYDNMGFRLGQGGGYYDRFLAKHRVCSVGLCRERLLVDAVPRQPHDMPVNFVLTEKRTMRLP